MSSCMHLAALSSVQRTSEACSSSNRLQQEPTSQPLLRAQAPVFGAGFRGQALRLRFAQSRTEARAGASSPEVTTDARHAALHDFCMIIPYSCAVATAGILSIPFGNGWRGLMLCCAGAMELFLTLKSLKQWRSGRPTRTFTAATAGLSLGLGGHFRANIRRRMAVWPNRAMLALSVAATLFLVYNILAGGNPPKEDPAVTTAEAAVPQKAY